MSGFGPISAAPRASLPPLSPSDSDPSFPFLSIHRFTFTRSLAHLDHSDEFTQYTHASIDRSSPSHRFNTLCFSTQSLSHGCDHRLFLFLFLTHPFLPPHYYSPTLNSNSLSFLSIIILTIKFPLNSHHSR